MESEKTKINNQPSALSKRESNWYSKFKAVEEMVKRNGHFPTRAENVALYDWCLYSFNSGAQEKRELLQSIGFEKYKTVDKADERWMRIYQKAKKISEKIGHFPTRTASPRIFYWACHWYKLYGAEQPDKVKMLEDIGFCPTEHILHKD